MKNINLRDYFTSAEAAKLVNRSQVLVRRRCAEGDIPGAIKIGHSWLVPKSELRLISKTRPRGN